MPVGRTLPTRGIRPMPVGLLAAFAAVVGWVLVSGAWNDEQPWDDTQLWKDI